MNRTAYCLLAIAGLLTLPSCSSEMPEDISPISEISENVEFRIEIPTELGSRAGFYGEGVRVDIDMLIYSLFEVQNPGKDSENLECISDYNKAITSINYGIDAVHMHLLKGHTYMVTFFACNSGNDEFVRYSQGSVKVDYSKDMANEKQFDVFVGRSAIFTVHEGYTEVVRLTRPFAQLNWGAADFQDPSLDKYRERMTAQVKISAGMLYNKFNVATGKVEEPVQKETTFPIFNLENCPDANEVAFPVANGDTQYQLLNMHYVLVGDDGSTGKIVMQLKGGPKDADISVENAPLVRNCRTNVYGNFFTSHTVVKMEVQSEYNDSDSPDDPHNVNL